MVLFNYAVAFHEIQSYQIKQTSCTCQQQHLHEFCNQLVHHLLAFFLSPSYKCIQCSPVSQGVHGSVAHYMCVMYCVQVSLLDWRGPVHSLAEHLILSCRVTIYL